MPSDYDQIRRENEVEYGKGTRHLGFFRTLYGDRTHFIFELLQNAEDAGATRIQFDLREDSLEVTHDGRPFNEKDVRGICGVGEGTKAGDLTQIGKFGIGFKSVYAFTESPEVHSGDEHFRIEKFVRPAEAPARLTQPGETLFVLPFDYSKVPAPEAFHCVRKGLMDLDRRTLLFLRNIQDIMWSAHEAAEGTYRRETMETPGSVRRVTLLPSIGPGTTEAKEEWLVFARPVSPPENLEHTQAKTAYVEAAFSVVADEKTKGEQIERMHPSPLVAFFPTEKETNLGFLIQGPYRTTPARDNVPHEDAWNRRLVEETAMLVVDALGQLKEMGLLTVDVLQTMPIRRDDFPEGSMFRPVFDRVKEALGTHPLLPTQDGSFAPAMGAKLAGGKDLCDLLIAQQLRELCGADTPLAWLSTGITKDRTRYLQDYLVNQLRVDEIDAEGFAGRITEVFLNRQSDEWMIRFYRWLDGRQSLVRCSRGPGYYYPSGALLSKPFIRLENGGHVAPFKKDGSPMAYLPAEADTHFATVKRVIADDPAATEFLKHLGMSEPDLVDEVLDYLLPKYGDSEGAPSDPAEHTRDIEAILRAMETDSVAQKTRLLRGLRNSPWVRAVNAATGQPAYRKAGEVYFRTPELALYFEGNHDTWVIDEPDRGRAAFKELGVQGAVVIRARGSGPPFSVELCSQSGSHQRGVNGFDPQASVPGLAHALARPAREKSAFVWNSILCGKAYLIHGTIESCSREKFDRYVGAQENVLSEMGKIATESEWLPGPDGQFHKPSELALDELPEEFRRDEDLAKQLGMKQPPPPKAPELQVLASRLGVPEEEVEQFVEEVEEFAGVMKDPQEREAWRSFRRQRKAVVGTSGEAAFPERPVKDPGRREDKDKADLDNAPLKTSETRERTVRISEPDLKPREYLKGQYTINGELVCQMCQKVMPFRKRGREYYFEAVQVADDLPKEHVAVYLALCPNCAALYKEWVKGKGGEEELERVKQALREEEGPEIKMNLDERERTLRFVEAHRLDLRTVLRDMGK